MEQSNERNVLKNLPQRISHLGMMAFGVSVGIATYYYFLGLYISAIMVASFAFCAVVILTLQYFNILKRAHSFILASICLMLITSGFIEGSGTGQYFYFFSIIVVIPVIVDYKNSSNIDFFCTYTAVIISFAICFYFGQNYKSLETIPLPIKHQMLYTNAASALFLTLCFSLSYIYYEKKHLKAITNEKNNAIATRTKFLSTMGHELRTPLNGIIGALNIIKDEQPQFVENEYFAILKYCSNHMQQLINDILDFNKIEADKLTIHPIDVNLKQLLVNSTLPFYNQIEEKKLQLIVEIDERLDTILLVDDVRLIQILNNLLSNAMKFTEHGYVKLIAECSNFSSEMIDVDFKIEDTGMGIRTEDQDRIFESFGQIFNEGSRKYSGTGLGLTICLRLLKLMGSCLQLTSEIQKGSTFSFNLSLKRSSEKQQIINQGTNEAEDINGLKILIVEDNQINMMIVKKMLTGKQAACDCAFNGQEALQQLANDAGYNMILLDLEMPVMDGYTAIKEIKRLYPEIPVIALTASLIDEHIVSALLETGFEDYVLKPFQPNHLFTKIKKYSKQISTLVTGNKLAK